MNERFLCKAKRLDNGEWITGNVVFDWSPFERENTIRSAMIREPLGPIGETHVIDTKTLCACTGLKDKNGVLIFEGDYFWHMIEEGLVAHIVWSNDDLRWDVAIVPNVKTNQCVPDFSNTLEWWELWEYGEIEVIGNVNDKE